MSDVRHALKLSFIAQYASLILQFATSVIVARLLLPAEVGIFSVAAGLVLIGQTLRDFGTGQYVIQEKELTESRIRAAMSVTLLIGWFIAACVFLIAPLAGRIYGEAGMTSVLYLLSINFLLLPFSTITAACLRREMQFGAITTARISSVAVQSGVTIACAFYGLSYMSMAWGAIAGTISTILVVNRYRPSGMPWMPGVAEIPHVLSFGSKLSIVEFLRVFAVTIPEMVIGKFMGMHAAGILSRSQGTMQLFSTIVFRGIGPVINPYFSRINRHAEDIKRPYVFTVSCISGLAWPFFAALSIVAPDLILTLFGPNWSEVSPLVQIWCATSLFNHLTFLTENILASLGKVDQLLRFSIMHHGISILTLGIAAVFVELQTLAFLFVAMSAVRFALAYPYIKQTVDVGFIDYVKIIRQSAPLALATAAGAAASTFLLKPYLELSGLGNLFLATAIGGLAWCLVLWLSEHPLKGEIRRLLPVP